MRDFLKSGQRWLQAGWLLPIVLIALPNCALDSSGTLAGQDPPATATFDPGPAPQTEAVMCDIPKVQAPGSDCAQGDESNIFLTSAAVGLAEGQNSSLVLDFSPDAISACGGPRKVEFFGTFPDGSHVCLNCAAQIGPSPKKYADAQAVCVAKCVDLVNLDGKEPPDGVQAYCEANAKVSTNVNEICYQGACTNNGLPDLPAFNDPRRNQEPVKWVDFEGAIELGSATPGGLDNTVKKAGAGNIGEFDTSAQSDKLITRGDAWIEFAAAETGVSHVVGVSTDTGIGSDLTIENVAFALSLNYDMENVYVLEQGAVAAAMIEKYAPGQRFRIEIKDNNDINNTATISYAKLDGACAVGTPCKKIPLMAPQGTLAYPIRVSAMFREPGATLENVTMVRIQTP